MWPKPRHAVTLSRRCIPLVSSLCPSLLSLLASDGGEEDIVCFRFFCIFLFFLLVVSSVGSFGYFSIFFLFFTYLAFFSVISLLVSPCTVWSQLTSYISFVSLAPCFISFNSFICFISVLPSRLYFLTHQDPSVPHLFCFLLFPSLHYIMLCGSLMSLRLIKLVM